jgi:site-specific recombinase XerD
MLNSKNATGGKQMKTRPDDNAKVFLKLMDHEILRRYDSTYMGIRLVQRDKSVYTVMADYGLRTRELQMLDITNIGPNHDQPQYGNYGYIDVCCVKGTKGSDIIYRRVRTMSMRAAENLKWYTEEVRPSFIGRHTKDIKALLYSECGNRLGTESIAIRLKKYLHMFGMDGKLVPNSFRYYLLYNLQPESE